MGGCGRKLSSEGRIGACCNMPLRCVRYSDTPVSPRRQNLLTSSLWDADKGVPFDSCIFAAGLELQAVFLREDVAGALDFDGLARVVPAEGMGGDIGDFLQERGGEPAQPRHQRAAQNQVVEASDMLGVEQVLKLAASEFRVVLERRIVSGIHNIVGDVERARAVTLE